MRFLVVGAISFVVVLSWCSETGAQPSAGTSTVPEWIDLVGTRDGIPDAAGEFSVVVRDAASNPVPSAVVRLLFAGCSDLRPSSVQPYPGVTVSCAPWFGPAGEVVSAVADANGVARFVVVGSVWRRAPWSTHGCVEVRADPGNVLLGTASAAVYDQDGIDGVNPNDIALTACDLFVIQSRPRSDYTHNGSSLTPLAMSEARYWAGTSAETGARCDSQIVRSPGLTSGSYRLSWSDCRSGDGTEELSFTCNTNSGTLPPLKCSFVAPLALASLRAFEATVDLVGEPGSPLPPWWEFHAGGCRASAFQVAMPQAGACTSPFNFEGTIFRRIEYPFGAPNVARIRIAGFVNEPVAIAANTEYDLFQFTIGRARTVQDLIGPAPCAGCSSPVTFKLRSVRLIQAGGCTEPDARGSLYPYLAMGRPDELSHAIAQGPVTGVEDPAVGTGIALRPDGMLPSRGDIAIAFTLPRAGTAEIDVLDAAGRRVVEQRLQGFDAGTHRIALVGPGSLPAGVYLIRLRQGEESARLKWVVLP